MGIFSPGPWGPWCLERGSPRWCAAAATRGSNIGTTITAILASMVTGSPAAITVALAHLTFNCCGTVIWYPLRWVPITLAKKLAYLAVNYKSIALAYVVILFYIIPLLIVFL